MIVVVVTLAKKQQDREHQDKKFVNYRIESNFYTSARDAKCAIYVCVKNSWHFIRITLTT